MSLGLTVLATGRPRRGCSGASGERKPLARHGSPALVATCAAFIPVVVLGLCYLSIATQRARCGRNGETCPIPWSPRAWMARLEWADPLSLAIRDGLPWTDR